MKENNNTRLDSLLVEKNLASSKTHARGLIMSGLVSVKGQKVEKPGTQVKRDASIRVEQAPRRFVSRGGVKLEKAITHFQVFVEGKVALDVGASTGGFTDCLLRYGASKVYAFDVGYGQIDWKLRNDRRVIVRERINCRYIKPEDIGETVDIVTVDVSFISLTNILRPAVSVLCKNGVLLALVKPQFEVGKGKVGKKGIVRDEVKQMDVIDKITLHINELGLEAKNFVESPIKGAGGNREFFLCATK